MAREVLFLSAGEGNVSVSLSRPQKRCAWSRKAQFGPGCPLLRLGGTDTALPERNVSARHATEVLWPFDLRESPDPRPARAMRDACSPGRSCREIPALILHPVRVVDRPSGRRLTPWPKYWKWSFSAGKGPRAEKKAAVRSPSARGSGRSSRQTRGPRRRAATTDFSNPNFAPQRQSVTPHTPPVWNAHTLSLIHI